jgi:hypothetical protein
MVQRLDAADCASLHPPYALLFPMSQLTLALPDTALERLEALAKARGERLETLAERVLVNASEQVGGASVLTEAQRAELVRRVAEGVEIADDDEVEAFFRDVDRD